MSKEEESLIEEVDNTSDESSVEEEVKEETSVPLSQYEKIKDDYLRPLNSTIIKRELKKKKKA